MIQYQTIDRMLFLHRLRELIRQGLFGKAKRGEPAYDDEPTFHSTYPKGYNPGGMDDYNHWIKQIHVNERKKFFGNSKDKLSKYRRVS
jgi:hypothetical protein